jgi:hypothetical protein
MIQCLLSFPQHKSRVTVNDDGFIQCFKYDGSACDYDSFWDQTEAADYIMTPLPNFVYRVVLTDE